MPVFQVVRWFKLVFGGRLKYSVRELKQSASICTEDAERTGRMVDELGLDGITK